SNSGRAGVRARARRRPGRARAERGPAPRRGPPRGGISRGALGCLLRHTERTPHTPAQAHRLGRFRRLGSPTWATWAWAETGLGRKLGLGGNWAWAETPQPRCRSSSVGSNRFPRTVSPHACAEVSRLGRFPRLSDAKDPAPGGNPLVGS